MKYFLSIIILLLIIVSSLSAGKLPISYQGKLTDQYNNPVPDGSYTIIFSLFDDSLSSSPIWSETASVNVKLGLFNHQLGSDNSFPDNLFSENDKLYLEVKIENETITTKTLLTDVPFSKNASSITMFDNNDSLSIKSFSNEHKLIIYGYDEDSSNIVLQAGKQGDSAIIFPESSISADEMFNEPGVIYNYSNSVKYLGQGYMTDLITVEIDIPTDGYVVAHGKCYVVFSGTTNANRAWIQIDMTSGGTGKFPFYNMVGLGGYVNNNENYFPVHVMRVYYLEAGKHIIIMEGEALDSPPANAETWDHQITATFYPSHYFPPFKKNDIIQSDTGEIIFDQTTDDYKKLRLNK
ncbi:MAG: hypothetical protein DRP35_06070 [Candidatus Zixiibacteriota bacterium]|nr:MAG: hypothetical protein DRP35_06070 [candidate division Zixibacteria bacterium]